MPRAFALPCIAAILMLSVSIVSKSPIESQAAGPQVFPGSALAWGYNVSGQLGNGTTTNTGCGCIDTPVQVSLPSGTTVTAIAGGLYDSIALTSSGNVLAWGDGGYGELGNGGLGQSSIPGVVNLPPGTTVTAISSGLYFNLALTSAGQVYAWGANNYGQLGNGAASNSGCFCIATPGQVTLPSGTNVIAIASGSNHSLALTSTGQVLAWGNGTRGQLGNGTTMQSAVPVPVSLPSGPAVTAIAGGGEHSLALDSSGHMLAWGYNFYGQLGNGTTTISTVPVPVSLPSGILVSAIAGGKNHSLAVTSNGKVYDWGSNVTGQLGNGTNVDSNTPVQVALPSGTTVTAVAGSSAHSLALTSTGQVLAWGFNGDGELGNGNAGVDSNTPVMVSLSAGTTVIAIAAGTSHGLAIQQITAAAFPALSNGAYGGYVTATTIQNIGSAPAAIQISYFDQNGSPVGAGDLIGSLPVNASWTVRQNSGNSFPSSGGNAVQAGSAVVFSTQPIASFVNEFAPGNVGDATSYSGVQVPSGVGTTLYAPTIVNNAYGGYTTGIGLLNEGTAPTNVTITYRDGNGAVIQTQTVPSLAAHAYQALYSGDTVLALPGGFAGTAMITSSAGQPLGAVVNETGPGGQFSSYDAVPSGSTTLNLPVALNNAFGGYYTGMAIQNTSPAAGALSVTYHDVSGTATVKNFTIASNGYLGVYQGSATDGPPVGAYTATITSTLSLAAIVNEVAPSSTSAKQSTSYNTYSSGSAILHLPLVENTGSDPWNTGEGIMSTGNVSTTVTVAYYDAATGASVGTPQTQTLAPNAFWGLYQPTGGLPSGTRATAVVTTSAGGQVSGICNESNATTFMSYGGQ